MRVALYLVLVSVSLGFVRTAHASNFTYTRAFDDPTITVDDSFGSSAAIDNEFLVIGAPGHKIGGKAIGQAHLFDASTGTLLHTFDDPTPNTSGGIDVFGNAVAIDSNLIVIGAIWDDTNGRDAGQAHLFDATSGILLHTFNDPNPSDFDRFGYSVAIDGSNVLVGAGADDTHGNDAGLVFLFDATSGNLLHTFQPPVPSHDGGNFGSSVAINGNLVLIGSAYDNTGGTLTGKAHLFELSTGNLLHTFDDPTPTSNDQFGHSVSLDGRFALVGAFGDDTKGENSGQAHLFDVTTGDLLHTLNSPSPHIFDSFGLSVAIDAGRILIGESDDDTQGPRVGQAHLFDALSGNLLQTFDDPSPVDVERFGTSVAISGPRILIGAPNNESGQAHLYSIVPEPTSLLLGLIGYAGLMCCGRIRGSSCNF